MNIWILIYPTNKIVFEIFLFKLILKIWNIRTINFITIYFRAVGYYINSKMYVNKKIVYIKTSDYTKMLNVKKESLLSIKRE
jgi:hypothetical protein